MSPDIFYRNLGPWLRRQRESVSKTQEAMAALLDCSFQQIQKYESGVNRIPVDKLVAWCRICCAGFQAAVAAAEAEPQTDKKES